MPVKPPLYLLLIALNLTMSGSPPELAPPYQSRATLNFGKASQPLDHKNLDVALLRQTLIYYTNQARRIRSIDACIPDRKIRRAAQAHSEELARRKRLSHESESEENTHLIDRLANTGVDLANTLSGENLGVDYFLAIAGVPYYKKKENGKTIYVDAETKDQIAPHTYRSFAKRMVNNWLNSPPHRKNVLNKTFSRIGIGIATGRYQGLHAIYVTQNFLGSIDNP